MSSSGRWLRPNRRWSRRPSRHRTRLPPIPSGAPESKSRRRRCAGPWRQDSGACSDRMRPTRSATLSTRATRRSWISNSPRCFRFSTTVIRIPSGAARGNPRGASLAASPDRTCISRRPCVADNTSTRAPRPRWWPSVSIRSWRCVFGRRTGPVGKSRRTISWSLPMGTRATASSLRVGHVLTNSCGCI